ncbi:Na(+)-translocating NADH-quinone reductase subunit A [Lentisalinibacter salinarum]|uniref:Na(+)-translocating NADH-quinone reductase subunit A n=1 Tax=Lentisalinibacter salinarum TaxID=2992239 RepID=UPI0038640B27
MTERLSFQIRKGLDIPLAGKPEQVIESARPVGSVALLGLDYIGLKPRMAVKPGDRVRLGDPLFSDKQTPGVTYTAPGAGVVRDVNRGMRRVLQSVVIDLDGDEAVDFGSVAAGDRDGLDGEAVEEKLLTAGLWPAFRTRPYSKVPAPGSRPHAIFVKATDTHPLAPDAEVIVADAAEEFAAGLRLAAKLSDGPVYVCTGPDSRIAVPDEKPFVHAEFSGPHPAGLPGTHIHFLDPVSENKTVWTIGSQDVIAMARLFATGRLPTERIVSIAGPMVRRPRLLRTRVGASTEDLIAGELDDDTDTRVISGSVLSGRRASDWAAWMGRYHNQLTALPEGREREFLGWALPGTKKFSAIRAYAGPVLQKAGFRLTTSQNGSPRAMVPIGNFEKVMPLDILPAPLLKALVVGDTETARKLGCLELDEDDVALLSFVCSGKYDYGPALRANLTDIEKNG